MILQDVTPVLRGLVTGGNGEECTDWRRILWGADPKRFQGPRKIFSDQLIAAA